DSIVESINGNETKVTDLTLKNIKTGEISKLDIGAIFIFIGFTPNTWMIKEDIKVDEGGYLVTDYKMETSVRGIFACGDVRSQLVRQVTNAVGDGTTAAVAAEKYIEELEDKHAHRI
ncbi:MAG: NAD(P)/FAD-dependent oxidoreductase, partial [Candidatus Zixiibacteriota bacterium]